MDSLNSFLFSSQFSERRRKSAYKTSLCNAFRDTGQCSYGFYCRFAHGISELRPAPGVILYKTVKFHFINDSFVFLLVEVSKKELKKS